MDDMTFRIEIEKLIVDKNYWRQYACLNNSTANEIIVAEFDKRIRKHPMLWKWFFKLK